MSTIHTSARSLYRAILDAAMTAPEHAGALTPPDWRELGADEQCAPDFCTLSIQREHTGTEWVVKVADDCAESHSRMVAVHGPMRPTIGKVEFRFHGHLGARSSVSVTGIKPRLIALAETVRKHWALYGGGPKPAELKPAAKRATEWPVAIIRVWAAQLEEKDFSGAVLTGERIGVVYYAGARGNGLALAGPSQVDGLPSGVCSARRDDGRWTVAHMGSGLALCDTRGFGSRRAAEDAARAYAV